MSKNYELLTQEASEEEFENMAHQVSEKDKETERKAFKIKRLEEARPTRFGFGSSSPKELDEADIASKGLWEDVVTEENYDDLLKEENAIMDAHEHAMWSQAADLFGDPLKFLGNPFDRAEELQKELIECTRQAEELVADLDIEIGEVQEVETVAATADSTESN